MPRSRILTAALAVALVPATLAAHHGWGSYREDKPLTVDGTIVESTYANPHGTARLQTADKTWDVVLAPPSRMEARGLNQPMLTKGTKARVLGYQHKQQANEMRAERITIDGKTVELR
jgi:hypothetical protein